MLPDDPDYPTALDGAVFRGVMLMLLLRRPATDVGAYVIGNRRWRPPGDGEKGEDLVFHLVDHGFHVHHIAIERKIFPISVREPEAGLVEV